MEKVYGAFETIAKVKSGKFQEMRITESKEDTVTDHLFKALWFVIIVKKIWPVFISTLKKSEIYLNYNKNNRRHKERT